MTWYKVIVDKVKDTVTCVIQVAPGVALVASRTGAAEFNVDQFIALIKESLGTEATSWSSYVYVLNILLSTGFFIAAVGTYTTTRFWNLLRSNAQNNIKEKQKQTAPEIKIELPKEVKTPSHDILQNVTPSRSKAVAEEKDTSEQNQTVEETLADQFFKSRFLHFFINLAGKGYVLGSTASGFIGMRSLINLAHKWGGVSYIGDCSAEATSFWIVATALSSLLSYANFSSGNKYTLVRLPVYIKKLFVEKDQDGIVGWRKITSLELLKVLVGTTLGAIGSFYATPYILNVILNQNMCHLFGFSQIVLPDYIKYGLAAGYALSTLVVTTMMTLGARLISKEEDQQQGQFEHKVNAASLHARSEFGIFENPLRTCIKANALNIGIGTFLAVLSLTNFFISSLIIKIAVSVIGGYISFSNQKELDMEGMRVEREKRKLERLEATIDTSDIFSPSDPLSHPHTPTVSVATQGLLGTRVRSAHNLTDALIMSPRERSPSPS